MKDVYREVSDWERLVPRERDVLTGRRAGRRDDKRREQRRPAGSPGPTVPRPRWLPVAVVAAVVLLPAGVAAAALALLDDEGDSIAVGEASEESTTATSSAASAASASSSAPAVAAATAILLEYSGGELVTRECSDATGGGGCAPYDTVYEPLVVRCTPQDCTMQYIGGTSGSLAGPLALSGTTDAATAGCEETRWTLELTPVGEAVTEGIAHPARLVGTATASRVAQVLPTTNCLGAEDVFRYDATP